MKTKMKPLDVRFPLETAARIKAIAEATGETPSYVARKAMEEGLFYLNEMAKFTARHMPSQEGDSKSQLDLLK